MEKINHNNLDAIKAYYGNVQPKKTNEEKEQEETKPVKEYEPKKVEASALDAAAAQIWGAQLSKVDKSDSTVSKRIEQAFANSKFMKSLNELQGLDDDFVKYAMGNITGINCEKFVKYINQPLSQDTQIGLTEYFDTLIA